MQIRVMLAAFVLLTLLGASVMAQGSALLIGPVDGHGLREIALAQTPYVAAIAFDDFEVREAGIPSFVGNLKASQFVCEVGPAWELGSAMIGLGLRSWMSRLTGTQEYPLTYWTDANGLPVAYEDAHDGFGDLLPGYQEHTAAATREATAEQDSATELAVLVGGSVEFGNWAGSWQASYGASGLAGRVSGGYRLGEVVLTAGYRSWPMEHFYSGPVLGVEFRF